MSTTAIILAAGKSTRMKSKRPKALHEICGKPMVQYVLDACYEAGCSRILLVVGHGKDEIIAQFEHDRRIVWVEQTEQLGTGHAARMCEPYLRQQAGEVFILTADGPLIAGEFVEIIEQADATPEQREIREVFPSYYCVRSEELLLALSKLKNENKKKEYYLTDIYGILRGAGHKIVAVQAVTQEDVLSV